jgi:hypothetical protein
MSDSGNPFEVLEDFTAEEMAVDEPSEKEETPSPKEKPQSTNEKTGKERKVATLKLPLSETRCWFFQESVCNQGDLCVFIHDQEYPAPAPACRFYFNKGCRYGNCCKYSHANP